MHIFPLTCRVQLLSFEDNILELELVVLVSSARDN